MIKIGICDDELKTCENLNQMLLEYAEKKDYRIKVDTWSSGEELCSFLEKKMHIDILFLDIELMETNGIEVGRFIREKQENTELIIIYISSKTSYAMELFRMQPLDFLIKPLTQEMITDVMERSVRILEKINTMFECKSEGNYYRIPYRNILYFQSMNKHIRVVWKDDPIMFRGKLKDLAKTVPHNFLMINQSFLVNINYVTKCSYERLRMQNGDELLISQPYRKAVRGRIVEEEWKRMESYD